MYELKLTEHRGQIVADSRDVARAIGKEHRNLMRSINTYYKHLSQLKIERAKFFIPATYIDDQGKERPCYYLTRMGCDMVANKMTGERGTLFTAAYVTRFHEMEAELTKRRELRAEGKLEDLEVSDEINAGTYRPKDSELPEGQLTGEDVVTADSITEDQVVDYILAKHPNITGCFAANGDSVKLAVDGLERNKMEKKVKVIGFDANDDEIQDLKDGKVNGLIVQNPFGMGYATVVAAARASLNMGNEAVVNTGYTWVTKKNLKTDEVQKILYSK